MCYVAGVEAFAALGDPTRRHIVELLARRGAMPAGEISAHFDSARPTISRHLKVLHDAGLVRVHSVAQQRRYALEPKTLAKLEAWLAKHRRFWSEALDRLGRYVEEDRP